MVSYDTMAYLERQSKCDFINETSQNAAEWVLLHRLDEYCADAGYDAWKAEKQQDLELLRRQALLEEL